MLDFHRLARAAYGHGWALSGGPMTERVKTGCAVAVQLAAEHAHHPQVLEVTLRLGSLEGTWARVYERREKLYTQHLAAVAKAYRELTTSIDVDDELRRLRRNLGLAEDTSDEQRRHRELVAAALATAGRIAQQIMGDTNSPEYKAIVSAIADALVSAEAEGTAGGVAVVADQLGQYGVDWDAAWADANQALNDLGTYWSGAQGWLGSVVEGSATDLGHALAKVLDDGGDFDAMRAAAWGVLDGTDIRAVDTIIDLAMGQSFTRGMLSIYSQAGAQTVNFTTAGTGNVCPVCQGYEDNNPWPIGEAPQPAIHPNCVVGSTRIVIPDSARVPGDEQVRLALTYSSPTLSGNARAGTAAAVVEAERDFGRGSLRAVTVREYVGEIVTIRTASGKELTGTPNHPVATSSGWVGLAELNVGDHVLCSTSSEWEFGPIDPDIDNVPPTIEEIAEAVPVGFASVPTSAEHFHGDGAGSEVCIVRTDRLLMDDAESLLPQQGREPNLGDGNVLVDPALFRQGPGAQFLVPGFRSAHSVMGACGESGPFGGTGVRHPHVRAFTSVPGRNPSGEQFLADGGSRTVERLGEREFTLSSEVSRDDLLRVGQDSLAAQTAVVAADVDTGLGETSGNGIDTDAVGFRQALEAGSSFIAADQVVDVQRLDFTGQVFNLDTVGGWYLSNGIVSHNCRCTLVPVGDSLLTLSTSISKYLTKAS